MQKRTTQDLPRQEKELESLVVKLQSIYQPTRPRQEYISNLHYHLDQQLITQGVKSRPGGLRFLMIAALSVVSGTFLIVVVVRRLLASLKGLDQFTTQIESSSIDSIYPVV